MPRDLFAEYGIQPAQPTAQKAAPRDLFKEYGIEKPVVRSAPIAKSASTSKPTPSSNAIDPGLKFGESNALIGLGRGFSDIGEGLKQSVLWAGNKISPSLISDQQLADYTKKTQQERDFYEKTAAGQSGAGKTLRVAGNVLPGLLIPGGATGSVLKQTATGAATGAGLGATQFVNNGESRANNILLGTVLGGAGPKVLGSSPLKSTLMGGGIGAGTGAVMGAMEDLPEGANRLDNILLNASAGAGIGAAPGLLKGGAKLTKGALDHVVKPAITEFVPTQKAVADDLMGFLDEDKIGKTIARKQAGERLGLNLTPAEASGSATVGRGQGQIGRANKEVATELESFYSGQQGKQSQAIDDFLNTLSKKPDSAAEDARKVASDIISKKSKALQKAADPYYKKAEKIILPEEQTNALLANPIIASTHKKILSDPVWQASLKNHDPSSIKAMDLVKRKLWDEASKATREGASSEAGLLKQAHAELNNTLKTLSPDYKKATSMYSDSEAAPLLEKIKNSSIGKIAKMKDDQLKNVTKKLFDRTETNPDVLNKVASRLSKEDPEIVGRLMRNEIERRLSLSNGKNAQNFYSKVLKTDQDFNQFKTIAQHIPGASEKLDDMRLAFKYLVGPESVKGAVKMSRDSTNMTRSGTQNIIDIVRNMAGGKYDKTAADIITNPKWDEQLLKIRKIKDPNTKARTFARFIDKIYKKNPKADAATLSKFAAQGATENDI